jgi:hypothetical protein
MAMKYAKLFHPNGLPKYAKIAIFNMKLPSGNPGTEKKCL